jgi:integrase
MPIVKLDAAFCSVAHCELGKKKTDYYSNTQTGFGLECRPSGKKTFFQRYTVDGKLKQKALAAYGEVTFDQARKAGQRLRSEAILGGDPSAKQAAKRAIPLYRELAEQHLTHAASYQRSYDSTRRIIQNHVLPGWGKLRLDEIRQQDVTAWLMEKRQCGLAPATVEKIRIMFSRSFELARQWQLFDGNPVKYVPRVKFNNARERYLTSEEAERLRLACECSANPQLKHIVGLLLLTGARKSELLKAKWSDIDIEKRTWTLNMTKNGRGRHVPLSQAALAIIEQLPRYPNCPWLLPNPQTLLPFTDIKRSFMEARKLAGLDDVHIHDLRHSYASALAGSGVDLYTVGKLLGHVNVASTARYAHLANDTLMAAAEVGAAKLSVNW